MNKVPDNFKVEFDEKRYKFFLNVHVSYLKHWEDPPLHLVDAMIKGQLDERFPQRQHHVQFFLDRLKGIWNSMARFPEQKGVQVIVAELYPELRGFVVDMDTVNNEQVLITLPADQELVASWHPAWLEAYGNMKLVNAGVKGLLNPAQIRMAYSRAAYFRETIESYPISTAARSNPLKSGKDYHILVHPMRLELEVAIGAIRNLESEDAQKLLFDDLNEAVWKLVHTFGRTPFFKDFRKVIRQSLKMAQHQPCVIGANLPLVLPGGFFLKEETEAPRLSELKTIAAYFQARDPAKAASQVSYFHRDEMSERKRLIVKRGIPGVASLYPVSSLSTMDPALANEFLAFAKLGRSTFLSSQRELQAMVFTIPGATAERYGKAVESFWQEFIQTFGSNKDDGECITIISHFFPMSVTPRERKPLAQGRKRQDHDSASWLPMIVREIIALPSVPADPATIAACLAPNVSEAAVKKALDGLLASGMISYDSAYRRYHQRERNVVTGDEKAHEKILRIHEEMSELAAAVLEDPPETMRSVAIHVLIDPTVFEAARQRIREWLHGLLDRTSKERDQDQLYQLSIQMFKGPT
ncbi:MAG TPA: TIGR02147 family protein [Oligoflexus sp.]|uniref:TIGR02147 family protein n=1 Tax=Oligoflexus sp. TaxID=1971216 RepID=UPI002D5BF63C|nr:TIGR02147 family protein [Oligoflexus sp.]HYX34289.1 TIGR02147 family protein [Oligoflexus sp.]